ncbi:hypothetical protein LBMAG53_29080 [Planctomycetota bacterium]|nr:hypothetical protein LBMAG53_29080 [Planctomycetota bacterium]
MILICLLIVSAWCADGAPAAQKTLHLLICSGQSNMGGIDVPKTVVPPIQAAFPQDEIVVAKFAVGGMPILCWSKLPEDAGKTIGSVVAGTYHDSLIAAVTKALAGRRPDTLHFLWLQGETEGRNPTITQPYYEKELESLITTLRKDLARDDLFTVIARISDHGASRQLKAWEAVRAAQVAVAERLPRSRWIDTDDTSSGKTDEQKKASITGPNADVHYDSDGTALIGKRFAEAVIAQIKESAGKP